MRPPCDRTVSPGDRKGSPGLPQGVVFVQSLSAGEEQRQPLRRRTDVGFRDEVKMALRCPGGGGLAAGWALYYPMLPLTMTGPPVGSRVTGRQEDRAEGAGSRRGGGVGGCGQGSGPHVNAGAWGRVYRLESREMVTFSHLWGQTVQGERGAFSIPRPGFSGGSASCGDHGFIPTPHS